MRRFAQFLAIARLAALETVRQPICLLLMTVCVTLTAILPLVVSHTLGESAKMIADSGLALHFLFGLLLGGFAACTSLSSEVRRGTAATVLTKPVDRATFFLAKFAGLAAVMLLFSAVITAACVLSVRTAADAYTIDWHSAGPLLAAPVVAYLAAGLLNYLTRRPFAGDAFFLLSGLVLGVGLVVGFLDSQGAWTSFGAAYNGQVAMVSGLIAMAVMVLMALALALATRWEVVPTISMCSAVFLIGLVSDYLLGRHAAAHPFVAAIYAVIPNWQHFWLADAIHESQPIPLAYVARAAAYTAAYLLGVLLLGVASFRHTEVRA